ncbi:MAG: DSD1 family PLP-dependent enzyme [Burkholderiales bacterium]|nr:DSD1 family PLP-dependent enzyme [Burkholderiales bacterium]
MNQYIGLHKSQLDTPCLVIDKTKLLQNITYMQKLAQEKKVNVRPHTKTHKCTQLAKLQIEHGAIGVCVTKVAEAIVMAHSGVKGILITSPVVTPTKINNLVNVVKIAPDTTVVVDNLDNANLLNYTFSKFNLILNVILDIDAGIGRTGVDYSVALAMAKAINQLPQLNFIGIQCYAGQLQHITDINERKNKSHKILTKAGVIRNELIQCGIKCHILTGSGTGTFSIDAELACVTEIQPGSYCVMDQEYNNIEYKEIQFLSAMTMLSTVISVNHKSHVTVDAGTKVLYKVDTKPQIISHNSLCYDWDGFGDEQGKVYYRDNTGVLPILGEQIELIVAHCDPTINLFDEFYITENDIVIDKWDIDTRGCCK